MESVSDFFRFLPFVLLLAAALAAGCAWAVRTRFVLVDSGARMQETRNVAASCLVVVSGYVICHVLVRCARPLRVSNPAVNLVAEMILMCASVFIFAAHATWLARVTPHHATLKAGAWSGITVFCAELMHLWLAKRGVGPFIQFDYDEAAADFVKFSAGFSFACVGVAILLAAFAQRWSERRSSASHDVTSVRR